MYCSPLPSMQFALHKTTKLNGEYIEALVGGFTQMTSAEKPNINGYTQITIYYRVTEITAGTEYARVCRNTHVHMQQQNKKAVAVAPVDHKVTSNMENRKDSRTFVQAK